MVKKKAEYLKAIAKKEGIHINQTIAWVMVLMICLC
jgi:hypothetical protein